LLNESRNKWKSIPSNNYVMQLSFSPFDFKSTLRCFFGLGAGKRVRYGLTLVWHIVVWSIWLSRNDFIFSRKSTSAEQLVDKIKLYS
jgi:hypothetical protein